MTHRQVEYGLLILVIVVMSTIALVRLRHQSNQATAHLTATQTLNKANDLRSTRKYNDALSVLQQYLTDHPNDSKNNPDMYRMIAVVYTDEKQPQKALQYNQKAVAGQQNLSTSDYETMGDDAVSAGDKKAAINYYKQAISALEKSNRPDKDAYEAHLQYNISVLEKP